MLKSAKIFIIFLGLVFFIAAVGISIVSDYPDVIPVGIGIVGVFLIILPFTYQEKR